MSSMTVLLMKEIIILTITLPIVLSTCFSQCSQCFNDNNDLNPYSCISCYPNDSLPYISSCSSVSDQLKSYLGPAIIITALHLFMLSVGMGVYRQLASLLTWHYDFQGGSIAFQATNFAIVNSNDFKKTFGYQFIALLLIGLIFLFIVLVTDKMAHSPTGMLIKRKKVIFPVRLITLTFNVLLLSSLIQIVSLNSKIPFDAFPFILAVMGLTVIIIELVGVGIISNWKKFQVDDPHYYVLVQQMTSKKWYAKNNILVSLLVRATMICIYVGIFNKPQTVGIVIAILQTAYTIYFIALIRFSKMRYFIANVVSNILFVAILMTNYIGSVNDINSGVWNGCSVAYIALLICLVIWFFGCCVMEIIFRRERITKNLRSFYERFIKCEKIQDQIQVTRYDQNSHRERVNQFHANLLFRKEITDERTVTIEMQSPVTDN